MLRSLYAGVSGSRANQARMDVIANNIANVNTTGFKAARATFQEIMAQNLRTGSGPQQGNLRGSVSPMQIGLGTGLMTVESNFTAGNLTNTGVETDLAIQGSGFFIIRDGYTTLYTRDGHYQVDADGYLVVPSSGARVQGYSGGGPNGSYLADSTQSSGLSDLRFGVGTHRISKQTSNVSLKGNLNVDEDEWMTTVRVYDSLGREVPIGLEFDKNAIGDWSYTLTIPNEANPALPTVLNGTMAFDSEGRLTGLNGGVGTTLPITWDPGTGTNQTVTLDFREVSQLQDPSSAKVGFQEGYPVGVLEYVTVGKGGEVTGHFSNQQTLLLGQIALAGFANPTGLMKVGNNCYQATPASGTRVDGVPGLEGRGVIAPQQLEMSNVDLSEEFTDMIVTQRGLQANTKVITASDEILQDLMNIKR